MTRLRLITYITTAAVGLLVGFSCQLACDLARSERMEAIGGVETYKRQRIEHLERLRARIAATDPTIRQQELDRIDRQIDSIEHEETVQIGGEARRVK